VYVAGHSLGGHLTYNAASEAIRIDSSRVGKIATFNGLGLCLGITLFGDVVDEQRLNSQKNKIINYSVEGDPVSKGFLGFTTWHYGSVTTYSKSAVAPDAHSMLNFLTRLEPLGRAS
jgi:hypothetical protein